MLLNYELSKSKNSYKTFPIVIIHGLFGDLSNLKTLANNLTQFCDVIRVDLRNHGKSPHNKIMTYFVMTQDVINLLNYLSINNCIVLGHSMGGKVAMMLGILDNNRINKIIIIDIAPKKYDIHAHHNIFNAIQYINSNNIKNRTSMISIMKQNNIDSHIILFLLKSFQQGKWNFNFDSIIKNYTNLSDWTTHQICWKSSLFIKGAMSSYIKKSYIQDIYNQFPFSYICTVPNANHWVHYDNPKYTFNLIKDFIFDKIPYKLLNFNNNLLIK